MKLIHTDHVFADGKFLNWKVTFVYLQKLFLFIFFTWSINIVLSKINTNENVTVT